MEDLEQPKAPAPSEYPELDAALGTTGEAEAQKASDVVVEEKKEEASESVKEVKIPKKFRKEDGSLDEEKLDKSLSAIEEKLKKYEELEKKLHSPEEVAKRKRLDDVFSDLSRPIVPELPTDVDFYSNPKEVIQAEVRKAVAPYQAKIIVNELAHAAEKCRNTLPNFKDWESDIAEEITKTPSLSALLRLGDPSVFEIAYGKVLAKKLPEVEKQAYERGKTEKQAIVNSTPKVEGVSATPPTPIPVPIKKRFEELAKEGKTLDQILVDDAVMSEGELRAFKKYSQL